jgi:hypothetical protein
MSKTKDIFLKIVAVSGCIILSPIVIVLAPIILALADEDELKENGLMLSSRERYSKYND